MRIVIEGPDGSGKSTLIQRFRDRYPQLQLMARACTSTDGPIDELARWVERDSLDISTDALQSRLYDRHPLVSELIYSPALGRSLADKFSDVNWLIEALTWFRGMNYIVIYCLPPREHVIDNVRATHLADTEHQEGVRQNIGRIYDLYYIRACIEHMWPHRYRWNYVTDDWAQLAETFDRWLDGPR